MKNIYEVQAGNKIKSALVVVFFAVFVALSVWVLSKGASVYLGYEPGALGFSGIALILSGIMTFGSYYFSDRIVLGISGARPANKNEDRLFTSVIDNLVLAKGLPKPKLYVIDDTAPNAFATGRDPQHAVVCATTGLLQKLTRTELEGVMAHELTHIRNYDIRLMSLVAVMVGMVALLADWFFRLSFHGGRRDRDKTGIDALIIVLGIVFALLSPIIAQLIQLAISRRREFMADAGSVDMTRQPSGLISALKKISLDHEPLEAANKATAHLYIANPFKDKMASSVSWFSGLFNTHPPIEERVKVLSQML